MEDALKGIANRRHLEHVLGDELRLHPSSGQPLAVALLDVDQFRSINDRFTHQVGDRVLKTVAGIMSSQLGERDLPARWAGDEFVIEFGNATASSAAHMRKNVRIAATSFNCESIAANLRPPRRRTRSHPTRHQMLRKRPHLRRLPPLARADQMHGDLRRRPVGQQHLQVAARHLVLEQPGRREADAHA